MMLYVRYPLSLRQIEDLLFERCIDICHETVRYWWNRFGPFVCRGDPETTVFIVDPIRCGAGILMRCSSASTARRIIYGVIRRAGSTPIGSLTR